MTVLEVVIAMGIGGLLLGVLASIVSLVVWLPGERGDRASVAQDVQNAEFWIARDANLARSFAPGTSPEYGTFNWVDLDGTFEIDFLVTYSYDAVNGYLMRTEQQNGVTSRTLAVAKNIASLSDVGFGWDPSTYSVQVSITSTLPEVSRESGNTPIQRSAVINAALRPRTEQSAVPPGGPPLPTPVPGSQTYQVCNELWLINGSYVSGGCNSLASSDGVFYVADASGSPYGVQYTVTFQLVNLPVPTSSIQVIVVAQYSGARRTAIDVTAKNSDSGFPASSDAGITSVVDNQNHTISYYLDAYALSYVTSLP